MLAKDRLTNNNQESQLNKSQIKFIVKKILSNYFWKFIDRVSYKNKKIAEIYEKAIGEQYKKECKVFNIKKYKKALHIGCGAYPLTEIILSDLPGEKVVGIDKNINAVLFAKEIIKNKNLDKKILIDEGNGLNYSTDGFDVVIVSSCSTPKEKIIDNIIRNADKNCMIIIREIASGADIVIDYIQSRNDVELVKKIQFSTLFPMPLSWISIHLIKIGESVHEYT